MNAVYRWMIRVSGRRRRRTVFARVICAIPVQDKPKMFLLFL